MNDKDEITGKKIKVVKPDEPVTTIDSDNNLEATLLIGSINGTIKNDVFESFSTAAQTREAAYELIDTMGQDATIAAALESYAEDITQTNDKGEIFWAESEDGDASKYINYLIKKLDVDQKAFSWAYNLVKYGDVYVRLLRESDFDNSIIFGKKKHIESSTDEKSKNELLTEDVFINVSRPGDHYAFAFDTVKNPGEMFELTKYGKSIGYIQAGVNVQKDFSSDNTSSYFTRYNMRRNDVNIYSPTEFVHACLEESTSRSDEELDLFLNDSDYSEKKNAETFSVRRGAGILNDLFKDWRQLSLLENSVLLNRLTRSSVVRAVQMEVGDMPANQVMNVTSRVKNMLETKAAVDTGNKMSEYTNPGPLENTVILPTRNGKGAITINQIGGDVDPKQLTDLDWFNNKLFGGLKIPKQYFGFTDDSTGFNGGTSLTIIDSRYGKAIKRCQKCLTQMVTDMINLILIDVGKTKYINNFTIKMQTPVTQEEIDKKANLSNTLRNVSDIMNTLNDIKDTAARLKILKALLSQCISDPSVIEVLDDEIKKAGKEESTEGTENSATPDVGGYENSGGDAFEDLLNSVPEEQTEGSEGEEENTSPESETPEESTESEPTTSGQAQSKTPEATRNSGSTDLPSFSDLGIDGTVNM